MCGEGFDSAVTGMDNTSVSIHVPHSLGTSSCLDKNDSVTFSRKESSGSFRMSSTSFIYIPRKEDFYRTVSPNFFTNRLNCCTEELGAESISNMISEEVVSRLDTSVGMLEHADLRNRGNPRVVNVKHDTFREADGDPRDIRNAQNMLEEIKNAQRDLRGGTSKGYDKFPPPISSLASNETHMILQSYRTNGRFVLRKIEYRCPKMFRAKRWGGRLRLEVLSPLVEGSKDFSAVSASLAEEASPATRKEMGMESCSFAAEEIIDDSTDVESVGKGKKYQIQSDITLSVDLQPETEGSCRLREETLAEQESHVEAAKNAENIFRAELIGIRQTDSTGNDTEDDRKALVLEATKVSCLNLFYAGFVDALLCLIATQYSVQRLLRESYLSRTGRGNMLKPRGDFALLFAKLWWWQPAETMDAWGGRMMYQLTPSKRKDYAHQLQDMMLTEKSWAPLHNLSLLVFSNKGRVNYNVCATYSWKDLSSSLTDKMEASVRSTDPAEPL